MLDFGRQLVKVICAVFLNKHETSVWALVPFGFFREWTKKPALSGIVKVSQECMMILERDRSSCSDAPKSFIWGSECRRINFKSTTSSFTPQSWVLLIPLSLVVVSHQYILTWHIFVHYSPWHFVSYFIEHRRAERVTNLIFKWIGIVILDWYWNIFVSYFSLLFLPCWIKESFPLPLFLLSIFGSVAHGSSELLRVGRRHLEWKRETNIKTHSKGPMDFIPAFLFISTLSFADVSERWTSRHLNWSGRTTSRGLALKVILHLLCILRHLRSCFV